MINPFNSFLDEFFTLLIEYKHSTNRLYKVLKKDVEIYSKEQAILHYMSRLVISDWTELSKNGWERNYNTGISIETPKEAYKDEIDQLLSREFCLIYAQCYEGFEKFIKDCLFNLASRNSNFYKFLISLTKNRKSIELNRNSMPSNRNLFKALEKAGGQTFKQYSIVNNLNYNFKDVWFVLSESRHAITHSRSKLPKCKISNSINQLTLLDLLFNSKHIDNNTISIELDIEKYERLIKRLSEYAFQIFKSLSIEEKFEWNILLSN